MPNQGCLILDRHPIFGGERGATALRVPSGTLYLPADEATGRIATCEAGVARLRRRASARRHCRPIVTNHAEGIMNSRALRGLLAAALTGLYVACTDGPTAPASDIGVEESLAPLYSQSSDGRAIQDRYIIVFDDRTTDVSARVQELRRTHGAQVHYTYRSALKGFAATLSPSALGAVRRLGYVAFVEQDYEIALTTTQPNATWGLDRIDQADLPLSTTYTFNVSGAGVNVYILDTGILTSHNEFGGRASVAFDALGGNGQDCNGHGTHVAGTIGGAVYGVAKGANLYAVRVLFCSGSGFSSGVIAGIDWVTQNHVAPAVANMSLGGSASIAMDNAVDNSIAAGVAYSIAAGNSNANACLVSPSRVSAALTVGASTQSDSRASFSNIGACLDLFAPGQGITSAWYTSNSATNTISGTSMAAPHVAGVAALYLETHPTASPTTVAQAIVDEAARGQITGVGAGSPNLLLYSLLDGGAAGPPLPPPPGSCAGCEYHTGTLSGTGDLNLQPNGTYYFVGAATQHAWLRGPSSANFNLYLFQFDLVQFRWIPVATSLGPTSDEEIQYAGSAGYYIWVVHSFQGSGQYDFWLERP